MVLKVSQQKLRPCVSMDFQINCAAQTNYFLLVTK